MTIGLERTGNRSRKGSSGNRFSSNSETGSHATWGGGKTEIQRGAISFFRVTNKTRSRKEKRNRKEWKRGDRGREGKEEKRERGTPMR